MRVHAHVPKLKVVFDTNVVISSLWPGVPRRALNLWRDERIIALISEPIVSEYLEVLSRFATSAEDAQEFLALLTDTSRSEMIVPEEQIKAVIADPSDDKFLECAIAGNANV